jgi:pyruvate formate lyase activating enzyme
MGNICFASSSLREAQYYLPYPEGKVRCKLCPKKCVLKQEARGDCGVRKNIKGKLYTLVYGNPCSCQIDPIEKKPVFHFLPGSLALSIATAGCNMHCLFCQNWQISQSRPEDLRNFELSPQAVVSLAQTKKCHSIAYTYSEPTVFFEYTYETAKLARKAGVKNVLVTSGFINPAPAKELAKYLDAATINLKGFTEDFYERICFGELEPIKQSAKIYHEEGVFIEVTYLVIPQLSDDLSIIGQMVAWVKKELGKETPLHFLRFHPTYKLKHLMPTPVKTLEKAREVALKAGLSYVYLGNVPGHSADHTYCPSCQKILIQRRGYFVQKNRLKEGKCSFCQQKIVGVWN